MLEQHETIVIHVERLEFFIGGEAIRLPQARARILMRHHLQALHAVLAAHFAAEEEGGYFASLLDDRPDLRPRADAIAGQHPVLRGRIVEMIGQMSRGMSAEAIAASIGEFITALRTHEAAERQLVVAATMQDTGVGD